MKSLTLEDHEYDDTKQEEDLTLLEKEHNLSMHFDSSIEEQDFIAEINKLQSSNIQDNSKDTDDLHSRTILDYE
ncbi:hypothetical protein DPMN_192538 [Dreissena polymorpha]|uniref:Uncharacterized protein n=1 Tax=Dreissena polymorpha TaxID=45954 RepID=A0A9D4BFG6_DREPO|nr:hypothetical protein DPMN_192538 [Dreissena polymorpha]